MGTSLGLSKARFPISSSLSTPLHTAHPLVEMGTSLGLSKARFPFSSRLSTPLHTAHPLAEMGTSLGLSKARFPFSSRLSTPPICKLDVGVDAHPSQRLKDLDGLGELQRLLQNANGGIEQKKRRGRPLKEKNSGGITVDYHIVRRFFSY
jgi:hypothetical protein